MLSRNNPVCRSPHFHQLIQKKRRFLLPMTLLFLAFYFSLPILISFVPDWMNLRVYGSITLAWFFAVSQCFMTILLSSIYMWRVRQFDRMVQAISQEVEREEGK